MMFDATNFSIAVMTDKGFENVSSNHVKYNYAWKYNKGMNLMMAIMPTTLLGVLPVGLLLVRGGSITPAELATGIILSLSIVGPLMKATTFILSLLHI